MHTEHYLKASEINGKTSVDFRGCEPDVARETISNDTRSCHPGSAGTTAARELPKGNLHFGQKSAVFLPYRNSTAASSTKLFFPPAFLPISSPRNRNRKKPFKKENSFPSAKPNLQGRLLKNTKSGILYQSRGVIPILSTPYSQI